MNILLCDSFDNAIIAYIVKKWSEVKTNIALGRTMVQKICYFLKAKGIPLDFKFDIYHYGPYSQELYFRMDELLADDIVLDKSEHKSKSKYVPGNQLDELLSKYNISNYEKDIDDIINLFNQFHPTEMELLATIHYLQNTSTKYYGTPPQKDEIINKVISIKRGRFDRELVSRAFDALEENGLFEWNLS